MELEYYIEQAKELYERDKELRSMQIGMEDMVHLQYELPGSVSDLEWVVKITNTTPYGAYKAGRRVLSGLDWRFRVWPKVVDDAGKTWANDLEKVLKWNVFQAFSRRASTREDIMGSALLYDEIVGQVIHLPTQIKAIESLGGNARRQKAALRYGPFAILLRNPKQVHTVYSDYMPESVLSVTVMPAKGITDFWGDAASTLLAEIKDDPVAQQHSYVLFDWCDYDERVVWCVEGESESDAVDSTAKMTILKEENKYGFLPWACSVGGSAIDDNVKYQRHPLLFPVWAGDHWNTSNILATLVISQAIAEVGSPKVKKTGPNPASITTDMSEPGGAYEAPSGHDVIDMAERGLDPALREATDRLVGNMQSSTVPPILMNAQSQPGESFSGYNLRLQSAIGQLLPYKRLGEGWGEQVARLVALWSQHTGQDLEGYWKEKEKSGFIKIDSEELDAESLRIELELTPDKKSDRLQVINGAVMMARELKVPVADVLEELGETDPEGKFEAWAMEQYDLTYLQADLQKIQMEASGQLQQLAQQMAQEIHAQMMKEQEAMSAEQAGSMANAQTGPMGMPGVEGQGVNPAMGGLAPAQVNPMATREMQTGMTRGGGQVGGA